GISVRVLFTLLLLVFLLSLAVGCFFFFQAEDGIRDLYVTGVQTCALPISIPEVAAVLRERIVCNFGNRRLRARGEIANDQISARIFLLLTLARDAFFGRRLGIGPFSRSRKIGRASCRERVQIWDVEVAIEE